MSAQSIILKDALGGYIRSRVPINYKFEILNTGKEISSPLYIGDIPENRTLTLLPR